MTATVEVKIDQKDKYVIVAISGEVDLYSSPKVRKSIITLTSKKIPTLAIDLTDVSYMDSSGVATLVEGLQITEKYNGKLLLCGLNSMVREVFELSRLDTVFSIYENLKILKEQNNIN
jgi:anti-sigma B factor antagonist